jgi:hypothetical protein
MRWKVLPDTSFFITLADEARRHHRIAVQYYQYWLANGIPIFLSTIVASEFTVRQPLTDLPLSSFRPLPFNLPDSIKTGEIFSQLNRDFGDSRPQFKDDMKILAQASQNEIGMRAKAHSSPL